MPTKRHRSIPLRAKRLVAEPSPMSPPLITMGAVASPVVRTGGQGISAEFVIQGLTEFGIWHPTGGQGRWALIGLTVLMSFIQNQIEAWKGRRLVGVPPE